MRYAIATLTLMGISAPALAAVQAVTVTGKAGFVGIERICEFSSNPCQNTRVQGVMTFSITANVDGDSNFYQDGNYQLSTYLTNTQIYFNDEWEFGDASHANISFEPIDFSNALPGLIATSGHATGGLILAPSRGSNIFTSLDIADFTYSSVRVFGLADKVPFSNGGVGFSWKPLPEPATWMMMLIGFGLIGAIARTTATEKRTAS